jgi:hypothetical protein
VVTGDDAVQAGGFGSAGGVEHLAWELPRAGVPGADEDGDVGRLHPGSLREAGAAECWVVRG